MDTKLLKSLIEIPSELGEEGTITSFIEQSLKPREQHWKLSRIRNTLIYHPPVWGGKNPIGLFGHLDTIPPTPSWSRNPFKAEEIDGKLRGLGSSDMKAGIANMMRLILENVPADFSRDVLFFFYDREEGPLPDGLTDIIQDWDSLQKLEFGICLEPTDNALELGCLGRISTTIRFKGKAAHAARVWLGENAVYKALPFLQLISEHMPIESRIGELIIRECLSVTKVTGGLSENVVPDRMDVSLDFRYSPERSPEEAEAHLHSLFPQGTEIVFESHSTGALVKPDHPVIEKMREVTGAVVRFKQAWTDAGQLASLDIPAVNYGPGLTTQAHQADEFIPLENVESHYRNLKNFLSS